MEKKRLLSLLLPLSQPLISAASRGLRSKTAGGKRGGGRVSEWAKAKKKRLLWVIDDIESLSTSRVFAAFIDVYTEQIQVRGIYVYSSVQWLCNRSTALPSFNHFLIGRIWQRPTNVVLVTRDFWLQVRISLFFRCQKKEFGFDSFRDIQSAEVLIPVCTIFHVLPSHKKWSIRCWTFSKRVILVQPAYCLKFLMVCRTRPWCRTFVQKTKLGK